MATDPEFTLVCHTDDIPEKGARRIHTQAYEVALFRTSSGEIFALKNECPHKKGPLSEGIVHGHAVACPLHNWVIDLKTGKAQGADEGCTPALDVSVDETGNVYLAIPRVAEAAA